MQNIVNEHIEKGHKITSLPKWVAVHLNDTHPVMSVVELMRILLDKYHLSWETSWGIVNRMVTYTNHTVLSESLEVQPMWLIEKHMPRIAIIIKEIDRRFRKELKYEHNFDDERVERMAILSKGKVYMTSLALYASHCVNGVSKIHSDILKDDLLHEFYEIYPDKFMNVTNGVSHRKWVANANPELHKFITKRIGDGYLTDANELKKLEKFAADKESLNELKAAKIANKKLKIVFVENFSVSVSELLTPATDVSEQISLVGKEASGTGNMKAIFNGALMIDTIDGANIEIMEKCGMDNSFPFGLTEADKDIIDHNGYNPMDYYNSDDRIRTVITYLDNGFNGESFHDISQYLLGETPHRDIYMCLADFGDYLRADALMDKTYRNSEEWYRKTLLSISRNYYFSSDRSIKEYAKKIWKL